MLSGILTRDTRIKVDQTIKIRYRTATGLSPTMTIYDDEGDVLSGYDGVTMTEISSTGIYEHSVLATSSWDTGDYTVVCEESTQDSRDSMVLTVKALFVAGEGVEEAVDAIGEIVSTVYLRTGTIEDLLGESTDVEASKTVFGMVNDIETTIDNLSLATVSTDARNAKTNALKAYEEVHSIKTNIDNIQEQVSSLQKLVKYIDEMKKNIARISKGISETTPGVIAAAAEAAAPAAAPGVIIVDGEVVTEVTEPVEGEVIEEGEVAEEVVTAEEQIKGLNNKVEELSALVKILTALIEEANDKPVVEGWFEME